MYEKSKLIDLKYQIFTVATQVAADFIREKQASHWLLVDSHPVTGNDKFTDVTMKKARS